MSSPADAEKADRPWLLTGLSAAVVLRTDAEMRLSRETRGGLVEWGGAYAQGIRLTGPWTISGSIDGTTYDLSSGHDGVDPLRWRLTSCHTWGPVRVVQAVLPHPTLPAVARTFELSSTRPARVRLVQRIQPFLAPVLVEGIEPYVYRVQARESSLEIRAFGSQAVLSPSMAPTEWSLDGRPWGGAEHVGEVGEIAVVHDIDVTSAPTTISLRVWGGVAAALGRGPELEALEASGVESWPQAADAAWSEWIARTPTMDLPDAPALARAYDLAKGALRALYTSPTAEITGLVAGYPWYPALWCRDLAWMLPAVMWLGDTDWAEASLRTAFRFQATSRIPLLGAEVGEIPMQISPGPVFLFGTSDTTLYYPDLVRRLVDHGGPLATAGELWPHLRAVADWARAKTDPATGLVSNGGEVEEMRNATAHIGSIHYGFDAVDTTIWDSTDRRDHAIDVQVLAFRAYRALLDLGDRLGRREHAGVDSAAADRLAFAIASRYRWPAESYLYDSLRRDGAPAPKVRPNALLAVSAGLVEPGAARTAVARAGQPDLATPWGWRTLSNRDIAYDPTAYHDGQVWTIATAWAADAAFAVGDPESGARALAIIADRILVESGLANECYRGDRAEPFDSCFLLGFSVAPFLTVLFERLWGLAVSAVDRRLTVEPAFPAAWRSARLGHLAFQGGFVDLSWTPEVLHVRWSGPGRVEIRSGGAAVDLVGPCEGTVALPAP